MEQIRKEILKCLSDCDGYLMPEKSILEYARLALPKILICDFDLQLRWLEEKRFIAGFRGALGGAAKWKITIDGKAALADEI